MPSKISICRKQFPTNQHHYILVHNKKCPHDVRKSVELGPCHPEHSIIKKFQTYILLKMHTSYCRYPENR